MYIWVKMGTMNQQVDDYFAFCTHADIGGLLLDARPAWVWTSAGDAIVWSNAAGVRAFKMQSVDALLQRRFGAASPAQAHIARIAMGDGRPTIEMLRFLTRIRSLSHTCLCRSLSIDGKVYVLTVATDPIPRFAQNIDDYAKRAIDVLTPYGGYIAIYDNDKTCLSGSGNKEILSQKEWIIPKYDSLKDLSLHSIHDVFIQTATGDHVTQALIISHDDKRYLLLHSTFDDQSEQKTTPNSVEISDNNDAEYKGINFVFTPHDKADRFTWEMDGKGFFTRISPELVRAIGPDAESLVGQNWTDICDWLKIDPKGEITAAIRNHETFTRQRINWPVTDTPLRVPVELTAMPAFGRDRGFIGYLGFGVCYTAQAETQHIDFKINSDDAEKQQNHIEQTTLATKQYSNKLLVSDINANIPQNEVQHSITSDQVELPSLDTETIYENDNSTDSSYGAAQWQSIEQLSDTNKQQDDVASDSSLSTHHITLTSEASICDTPSDEFDDKCHTPTSQNSEDQVSSTHLQLSESVPNSAKNHDMSAIKEHNLNLTDKVDDSPQSEEETSPLFDLAYADINARSAIEGRNYGEYSEISKEDNIEESDVLSPISSIDSSDDGDVIKADDTIAIDSSSNQNNINTKIHNEESELPLQSTTQGKPKRGKPNENEGEQHSAPSKTKVEDSLATQTLREEAPNEDTIIEEPPIRETATSEIETADTGQMALIARHIEQFNKAENHRHYNQTQNYLNSNHANTNQTVDLDRIPPIDESYESDSTETSTDIAWQKEPNEKIQAGSLTHEPPIVQFTEHKLSLSSPSEENKQLSGQEHRNFEEIARQLNSRFPITREAHVLTKYKHNNDDVSIDESGKNKTDHDSSQPSLEFADTEQSIKEPVLEGINIDASKMDDPQMGDPDMGELIEQFFAELEDETENKPHHAPVETYILERLPLGLFVYRDSDILFANRAALDLFHYETVNKLVGAGGIDALFPHAEDLIDDFRPEPFIALRSDGHKIDVHARLQMIPWEGEPACLLSVRTLDSSSGYDPSNQGSFAALPSNVQQGLAARVAELEAILDIATEGVLILDDQATILALNRSAEALFGYDPDEIVGQSLTHLLAEESHRSTLDYLDGLARAGVASVLNDGREVIGRVAQGGLIPLFMTIGPISGDKERYCAVLRDITQWKRAEDELVQARRTAENASAHKSDFLAKISHEIRTPLNGIIGFSEVMMEERFGSIGNERYKEYLKDIHMSGTHLMSLLNDLLDLSKIEAGKLDLDFTSVDINDVAQQCVAILQPQANRERIIIRTSLPQSVPNIVADQRSLRQIILNLVSNAIKFTMPGGQVIVSTSIEETGEVVFRVRDTGIGMSQTDLQRALEPFRRVATARVGADGTGLGLPLTKALVEANRAYFSIESELDQGTLIRITFPPQRVLAE